MAVQTADNQEPPTGGLINARASVPWPVSQFPVAFALHSENRCVVNWFSPLFYTSENPLWWIDRTPSAQAPLCDTCGKHGRCNPPCHRSRIPPCPACITLPSHPHRIARQGFAMWRGRHVTMSNLSPPCPWTRMPPPPVPALDLKPPASDSRTAACIQRCFTEFEWLLSFSHKGEIPVPWIGQNPSAQAPLWRYSL